MWQPLDRMFYAVTVINLVLPEKIELIWILRLCNKQWEILKDINTLNNVYNKFIQLIRGRKSSSYQNDALKWEVSKEN